MILIDSHIVVWMAFHPERLSARARQAIAAARKKGDGLAISGVSLWELAWAGAKGRFELDIPLKEFLAEIESRFTVLPISGTVCVRAVALPARFPKDPADRIIAATALAEGSPLVTADRAIRRSKAVATIW